MKYVFLITIALLLIGCEKHQNLDIQQISQNLLLAAKRGEKADSLRKYLATLEDSQLNKELTDDDEKKAFWLNIYNAYFQFEGRADSTIDMDIFNEPRIDIGDRLYSFDDIEHGILRAKEDYEFENLSVDSIDYRIHFALNCGAKSCPPIAFYEEEEIDKQLENATKLFLITSTNINYEKRTVRVTQLMEWFGEDFGGKKNLHNIIEKYTGEKVEGYTLEFIPFNWTAQFRNFK